MRFVCTDFFSCGEMTADKISENDLRIESKIDADEVQDYDKAIKKAVEKIYSPDGSGDKFLYASAECKKYEESFPLASTLMTIAEFNTLHGITLTNNLSLTTQKFFWNINKYSQISSSFFFTILTDKGVQLLKPARQLSSQQIKGSFLSRPINKNTNYKYYGETGADYYIGPNGDTIEPVLIDSTLKNLAVQKKKAMDDIVQFESGQDASPGDYYIDSEMERNAVYIIVNKKEKSNINGVMKWIYIAVREQLAVSSFAGADINNYIPGIKQAIVFKDVKNAGTHGGDFTSGADRTRTIALITNTIQGASIDSNKITLPAGKYKALIFVPAAEVGYHQATLKNVTDNSDTIIGKGMACPASATIDSIIMGEFILTGIKELSVIDRCSTTKSGSGFGIAVNLTRSEVYTSGEIEKIG